MAIRKISARDTFTWSYLCLVYACLVTSSVVCNRLLQDLLQVFTGAKPQRGRVPYATPVGTQYRSQKFWFIGWRNQPLQRLQCVLPLLPVKHWEQSETSLARTKSLCWAASPSMRQPCYIQEPSTSLGFYMSSFQKQQIHTGLVSQAFSGRLKPRWKFLMVT